MHLPVQTGAMMNAVWSVGMSLCEKTAKIVQDIEKAGINNL
jgi:hypothetical protein